MRREQLTRARRSPRVARVLGGGFVVLGVGLCSVVSCSTQGTPGGTEEVGQKEPEETGDEVDWSASVRKTTSSDITLEFDTEQIPMRVVVYSYTEVGESGVPEEGSGTETLCSFQEDGADICHYHGDGSGGARVVIDPPRPTDYLVVHAAWPTEMPSGAMDVASASWLLRPDV